MATYSSLSLGASGTFREVVVAGGKVWAPTSSNRMLSIVVSTATPSFLSTPVNVAGGGVIHDGTSVYAIAGGRIVPVDIASNTVGAAGYTFGGSPTCRWVGDGWYGCGGDPAAVRIRDAFAAHSTVSVPSAQYAGVAVSDNVLHAPSNTGRMVRIAFSTLAVADSAVTYVGNSAVFAFDTTVYVLDDNGDDLLVWDVASAAASYAKIPVSAQWRAAVTTDNNVYASAMWGTDVLTTGPVLSTSGWSIGTLRFGGGSGWH